MITAIIPARNEVYLQKTINSLLDNAKGEIEVIVILDGYWPDPPLAVDPRVHIVHNTEPKGLRRAINDAAALSRGEYLMKVDAHCSFAPGYDRVLVEDYQESQVVVPRRYRLDPEKWQVIEDGRPPVDYEYIDFSDLHGVKWDERAVERKDVLVDNIISAQGSCWFMSKAHFKAIGGVDEEAYGTFFLEFQEISFKTWTLGGRVVVNKRTWYSHWHKNKGRGYNLAAGEREKAVAFMKRWTDDNQKAWEGQKYNFTSVIEQFLPMPGWESNWKEALSVRA